MNKHIYGPIYTKETFMKKYCVREDTFRDWKNGVTENGSRLKVCRISHKYCYIYQQHIDEFFLEHVRGDDNE